MEWKDVLCFATWNIKSLNNKDQKTLKELSDNKINVYAQQETKKKGKGPKQYAEYIVIYSGVENHERAKEGVAIAKFQKCIQKCNYISPRILSVRLNTREQNVNIISIYAPEDNKRRTDRESSFNQLQTTIDQIPHDQPTIFLGDFNAHIYDEVK